MTGVDDEEWSALIGLLLVKIYGDSYEDPFQLDLEKRNPKQIDDVWYNSEII